MSTLSGKVVWITGASSGIGEALVHELAKHKATIVLSSRNESALAKVQQEAKLNENNSLILPLDLQEISLTAQRVQQVIDRFGRIDVLINNGGISQRSLVKDTPLELDRKIMEVNFFGTVALTKAVLPFMLKQKSGHIVVISSIAGKFGFFLRSAYSAAKHALHGFFESLRLEVFKENIHVLIVCPGKIKTAISVNALNAEGTTNNKMETSHENAMSAATCAQQIVTGLLNNEEEIYIGGKELRAVWMKRLFPKLFSKLIRKQKPE